MRAYIVIRATTNDRRRYLRPRPPRGDEGEGGGGEGGRRAGAALRRGDVVAQRPRRAGRPHGALPRRHLQGPQAGAVHQLPAHGVRGHLHGPVHRVRVARVGSAGARRREAGVEPAGLGHRQAARLRRRAPGALAAGPRRGGAQLPGGAAGRGHPRRGPRRGAQHGQPAAGARGRARRRPGPHRRPLHVLPGLLVRLGVPGHVHRARQRPGAGGRARREARAGDPHRGRVPLHRAPLPCRVQDRRRVRDGVVLHHHHPEVRRLCSFLPDCALFACSRIEMD
uniref:Uncharacterized protein n=1 Tax=Zea mays TaxID=4577 RepID=B4G0T2_MAIZE|nr:unknown [Zea mays]